MRCGLFSVLPFVFAATSLAVFRFASLQSNRGDLPELRHKSFYLALELQTRTPIVQDRQLRL